MSSETLPEDMILDILHRLPPRSLVRFLCVSKSWYSSITDPTFVKSITYNNTHSLLFMPRTPHSPCISIPLNSNNSSSSSIQFELGTFLFFVGSINGLVCIACKALNSLYLWNPSIRVHVSIPPPPDYHHSSSSSSSSWSWPNVKAGLWPSRSYYSLTENPNNDINPIIGFGFDPLTNDFKVIASSIMTRNFKYNIWIYSLNSASWKEIGEGDVDLYARWSLTSVSLHGMIYWIVGSRYSGLFDDDEESTIVAFDIEQEEFREMILPDCFTGEMGDHNLSLHRVDESLCLVSCHVPDWHTTCYLSDCQVWRLMEDDGCSWTKQWHVKLDLPFRDTNLYPLWILTPDGKALVKKPVQDPTKPWHFSVGFSFDAYDMKTGECSNILTRQLIFPLSHIIVTESLALLDLRPKKF